MYYYPKGFLRPTTLSSRRTVPVRRVPDHRMEADYHENSSIRPERVTPPVHGEQATRVEDVFVSSVKSNESNEDSPESSLPPAADDLAWKNKALELQAEMDNFRKRQRRRAEEAITQEKERLLSRFLSVADNLRRALAHADGATANLSQGVELTHRELIRILEDEGVTRLDTAGQPFDPTLHEAVAVLPAEAEPDTILEEVEAGYKLGDKLLRPAKVVVATE